jgi:hypothetical protein
VAKTAGLIDTIGDAGQESFPAAVCGGVEDLAGDGP